MLGRVSAAHGKIEKLTLVQGLLVENIFQKRIGKKMPKLSIRPGTLSDSYTVFNIFERALADLARRFGSTSSFSADDPLALERMWAERRSLYEHLAVTADQFCLAEREGTRLVMPAPLCAMGSAS